ncbi:MAG: hydroxymethylglutaryl-CoA lyase [Oscillospiraceae bacterium]|nr:hydroxymethylglutaryl-CoA lyase [Oscillospiraceae bacterium]
MEIVKDIRVCEVGLRDGLQNEKVILSIEDKASLVERLAGAGVKVIEAGSFMSPKAVPQMAGTDDVFRAVKQRGGVEYRALIANEKGVARAAECGCNKVKLNVSASRAHNLANLNRTPQESVAGFGPCVHLAKENSIEISGSISMPFGSPWEREIPVSQVEEIVEAYLAVGIDEISLSDAAGVACPTQVYEMCIRMKKRYPSVKWWLHFHNTRGMALANILAGMQAGFTQYDASFAGIGGCPFVPGAAGNVPTEDLVHMCDVMGVATGIDLTALIEIGGWVTQLLERATNSFVAHAGPNSALIRELPVGQIENQTKNRGEDKTMKHPLVPIFVDTKLIPLLGTPLRQTFAPRMQNAAYKAIGFDGCYFPVEIGTEHLEAVVNALRWMNVPGFAVTKPNKVEVLKYLDEVDDLARKMGACNTVVNKGGVLKGYNTDGEGCVTDLTQNGVDLPDSAFFCCGAGGAGKAVCFTLAHHGAKKIAVIDMVDEAAKLLADDLNRHFDNVAAFFPFTQKEDYLKAVRESNVVMNMSGVGMTSDETWIDKGELAHRPLCLDAVYNPLKTRFLIEAEEMGCKTLNGLGMSINQGALQVKLWTGHEEPYQVMAAEINAILKEMQG